MLLLLLLKNVGWTLRRIAGDIKCFPNTLKHILHREKETGEFAAGKRSGQPRKFSEKTVQFLCLTSLRDGKKYPMNYCSGRQPFFNVVQITLSIVIEGPLNLKPRLQN